MTRFQKVFCVVLSLCFFGILVLIPKPVFLRGDIFGQLPLYRFLENETMAVSARADRETDELLIENNAAYLGSLAVLENREREEVKASETTDVPEPTKAPKPTKIPEPTGVLKASEEEQGIMAALNPDPVIDLSPEILADYNYLMQEFFILDKGTATNEQQLNAARFMERDFTLEKNESDPQILIYHTHAQEAFADSREGVREDTIVGVGDYLTKLLTDTYGYQVLHVDLPFDIINGELDRSGAYDTARPYLEQILEEYPSVEVMIDLHRDGVAEGRHLITEVNGKPAAQVMCFNGLSYTVSRGALGYLENPFMEDNLAFSFQLEYQSELYYPDFFRGIYLAGYRYNLDLRPRSVLLEAGAQTNTVQEVKNAMEPFALLLNQVLGG